MSKEPDPESAAQTPGTSSTEEAADSGRTVLDPALPSLPDVNHVREARDALFARYVGPYRLTGLLGEGGMGQVYLATQEQPLRREVAVKVIKRGMDSDAIIARFTSERRALALMDHPAIARVLDAGTTDDGRPFVAMELVRGPRLTDYCDGARLSVHARLQLFLDVLLGVQHAHQKGVLHRDLKPSNILVATVDGQPQPKIIDFGIAKALADDEPLATRVTVAGHYVGTPEYMSPEQAGVLPAGVDTRSDVYSLGVVLFELLTGHRPYDFDRRTPTAVTARLTQVRLPVRPSAAVTTRAFGRHAESTDVDRAAARGSSPARLRRSLRGDLDTIVLKAMHPEPDRRYGSVEQFAGDLERYLGGLPVTARPDSWAYRTSRFMRRHTLGVAAVSLSLCAIAAFIVVLARERARAVEAEHQARIEAATAVQVSEFLVGLFDEADPANGRGREVTAREIVDRGAERIRTEMADAPVVRGQLLFTLGDVYRSLGRAASAEPLLREALAVREEAMGPEHPLVAETLNTLGRVRLDLGDIDGSLALYERALAIREAPDGPPTAELAEVLNNLGLVHLTAGRLPEAVAALTRAIEIRRGLDAADGEHGGGALYNLAVAHYQMGRYEKAEEMLREAEPLLRLQYGNSGPHPSFISAASFRGLILKELGRLDEARTVLEAGVADARALYPEPHGHLATILNNLAVVLRAQHDPGAEALYREVLAIDLELHGPDHADVAHSYFNLGTFLYGSGERVEGTRLVERSLEMRQRLLGTEHPTTAETMSRLASYRADAGRLREAIDLYEGAEKVQAAKLPADHPYLIDTRKSLDAVRARLR